MATERIATIVRIYRVDSKNRAIGIRRYHNGAPGTRVRYSGNWYDYLPFLYSGATVSLTGDNVTADLILSSNDIARSNVANLVNQNYRATILVCRMDADFDTIQSVLSEETWLVSSASYDSTAIQIQLSSGLDAVNANIPRRVLITADVGPLPVTGSLRI